MGEHVVVQAVGTHRGWLGIAVVAFPTRAMGVARVAGEAREPHLSDPPHGRPHPSCGVYILREWSNVIHS